MPLSMGAKCYLDLSKEDKSIWLVTTDQTLE